MEFEKWQGLGNDFIMIDGRKFEIEPPEKIKFLCDRNFGIGADGVIYILDSDKADVRMRIFNADGSEAEMCGNGIRCFAKYLDGKGEYSDGMKIETGAGILSVKKSGENVTVDMGEPILEADKIPVAGFGKKNVVGEDISVDGKTYKMTCVSMGNPHCIIFVDDLDAVKLEQIGRKFETHEKFPRKTNTEFVQVTGKDEVRMRVWERGSGITLACGTGACATAVAANLNKLCSKNVTVNLDGGSLQIEWRENNRIYMTGAATKVFSGQY